ncbi:MAG: hypothetical protein ACP6IP_04905 [Candidatus Njordarchaeia archaeon]
MLEWITVISGLAYLGVSIWGYTKKKSVDYISWVVSSLGFFIIAVALAILALDALALPITIYLGSIYPSFLAIGLLVRREPEGEIWKYYLYFTVFMLILMAIGQATNTALKLIALVTLHSISGLIIVFMPILQFFSKKWDVSYLMFSIGGIVIGIGGLALATIQAGAPMLPFDLVVALLHPLLFISAFLIALGVYLVMEK